MSNSKRSMFFFVMLITTLFCLNASVFGQGKRFELKIELTAEADAIANEQILKIADGLKDKYKLTEKQLYNMAKRKYAENLTLDEFSQMLTTGSMKWLKTFVKNLKNMSDQQSKTFWEDNKNKRLKDLKKVKSKITRKAKLPNKKKGKSGSQQSILLPDLRGIPGSLLIQKYYFSDQLRYGVTTVNQSISLRGRYNEHETPFYPEYNEISANFSGPAAGQSILEWFNVPVRDVQGNILTSTNDIQTRLADLMETEDGIDCTYPDDLARVLQMDEFATDKGVWYQEGGGSLHALRYLLSVGTPVILLIAEGDWWGYRTIYSNWCPWDASELIDLWSFENCSAGIDYINGWLIHPFTFFSYSPTGDDLAWDYEMEIPLEQLSEYLANGCDWYGSYYSDFNSNYVNGINENGRKLNYYATKQIHLFTPPYDSKVLVSSGGPYSSNTTISLNPNNTHILSSNQSSNMISNLSLNQPIEILAYIDRQFLNSNYSLFAGFILKDTNDNVIDSTYQDWGLAIDWNLSRADPYNYVFKFSDIYDPRYGKIVFSIHGGLRKLEWPLRGCNSDRDGDFICDEVDDDRDGDGIPNSLDNCPNRYNLENDCVDHLPVVVDFHQIELLAHSNWWKVLIDDPCIIEPENCFWTEAFRQLLIDFRSVFGRYDEKISDEMLKEQIIQVLKNKEQIKYYLK